MLTTGPRAPRSAWGTARQRRWQTGPEGPEVGLEALALQRQEPRETLEEGGLGDLISPPGSASKLSSDQGGYTSVPPSYMQSRVAYLLTGIAYIAVYERCAHSDAHKNPMFSARPTILVLKDANQSAGDHLTPRNNNQNVVACDVWTGQSHSIEHALDFRQIRLILMFSLYV